MPRLKQKLQTLLENAKRVAILGIGSELRGDDAVGLLVLNNLRHKIFAIKKRRIVCKLFNGGTAPENLTGEIRRFKPGHLIMIDAVELGKRPGTIALLDLKRIENTVFLTHKLPIKLMLDYLAFARMPLATEINGKATTATCPAKLEERSRKPEGRRRVAAEMAFTTIFIGIQPKSLDFGAHVSREVSHASRNLADLLFTALQ